MLSFIFFCDGPCDPESWRPSADETQWWARRDALVRIAASSLWADSGVPQPTVYSALFAFAEFARSAPQCGNEFIYGSSFRMTANVVDKIPIPTEQRLIHFWKRGFSASHHDNSFTWDISARNPVRFTFTTQMKPQPDENNSVSFDGTGGKREIIRLLQSNCSLQFLRDHNLNVSEAVAMKKLKLSSLTVAMKAYEKESQHPRERSDSSPETMKTGRIDLLELSKSWLVDALPPASTADYSKVSLLLLHEDYPHELPVFGCNSETSTPEIRHVICALGAVRDASSTEISAIIEAARCLGIRTVGANLGRTAEFTSKIVRALIAHAEAGNLLLLRAVAALPAINSLSTKSDGFPIEKLLPKRKGGWTWDGRRNKKQKRESYEQLPCLQFPLFPSSERDTFTPGLVVVYWLPFVSPLAVPMELERREEVHFLVQLITSTLWRSRVVSEQSTADSGNAPLMCSLVLVFRDGTVSRLTQQHIADAVTELHMAAPSEFQILRMLSSLLVTGTASYHKRDRKLSSAAHQSSTGNDLLRILDLSTEQWRKENIKRTMKRLMVLEAFASSGPVASDSGVPFQCLSDYAYIHPCRCYNTEDASTSISTSDPQIILLLNRPDAATSQEQLTTQTNFYEDTAVEALQMWLQMRCEKEELSLKQKHAIKRMYLPFHVLPVHYSLSPGTVVAILQHWAYHGRLFPAVQAAAHTRRKAHDT